MPYPRFEKLDPAKKEKILEAAKKEFAQNHYDQVNMSIIMKNAGFSTGAVYYYFENKEDLFNTVVEDVTDYFFKTVISRLDDPDIKNQPFWDRWEFLIRKRIELAISEPVIGALINRFFALLYDNKNSPSYQKHVEFLQKTMVQIMSQGIQEGAVRKDIPFDLLMRILSCVSITANIWVAENMDEIIQDVDQFLRWLRSMAEGLAGTSSQEKSSN